MTSLNIGPNLRKKRERKHWSREQLAEKTNLSATYIGMIERGEKIPKLDTFIRIINVLEVSSDEILEDAVHVSCCIRSNQYWKKIEKLTAKDRERLFQIIDIMIDAERD